MIAQGRAQVAQQVAQCASLNELYRRLADPLPLQDCTRFIFTDDQRRAIVESNNAFPFDFTRQPPSVSLGISLPIFQGLGRERTLEAARLARSDADQRIRQQLLALEAEVAIGLATVETAHRSALLEARNTEAAGESLRAVTERYRVGAATFQELVEAETLKAQADRDHLAAIYAYHDAATNLEAQVGAPIRAQP
jgi:outer membrane protein TolC